MAATPRRGKDCNEELEGEDTGDDADEIDDGGGNERAKRVGGRVQRKALVLTPRLFSTWKTLPARVHGSAFSLSALANLDTAPVQHYVARSARFAHSESLNDPVPAWLGASPVGQYGRCWARSMLLISIFSQPRSAPGSGPPAPERLLRARLVHASGAARAAP